MGLMSPNQLRPILTLFVLHTSVHSVPCLRRTQALNLRVPVSADGIRCRMSGSDHPTATSSAQGSTEAGKCAVLGVNYGESEK